MAARSALPLVVPLGGGAAGRSSDDELREHLPEASATTRLTVSSTCPCNETHNCSWGLGASALQGDLLTLNFCRRRRRCETSRSGALKARARESRRAFTVALQDMAARFASRAPQPHAKEKQHANHARGAREAAQGV